MKFDNLLLLFANWALVSCLFMSRKFMGSMKITLTQVNHWTEKDLGYLDLSHNASSALACVIIGYLTKGVRPDTILIGSVLLDAFAALATTFGTSFKLLLILSVLSGIGCSLVTQSGNFLVKALVDEDYFDIAICLFWTSASAGSVMSTLVMNFSGSWENCFYIAAGISFTCSLMAMFASRSVTLSTKSDEDDQNQETKNESKLPMNCHSKLLIGIVMIGQFVNCCLYSLPFFWTSYFSHDYYSMSKRGSGIMSIVYEAGFVSCIVFIHLINKCLPNTNGL